MRRIVFTNDKGGVGKTTTVVNLAVALAQKGQHILVIDMDPQADATFALLAERPPEARAGHVPPSMFALLTEHYPLNQVILPAPRYPGLFVIPANGDLADAALKIASVPTRLRRIVDSLPVGEYDAVLIDTGKGLDPLAVNALAAAREVIVMVSPGRLELDAIARVHEHVALVRDEILLGSTHPRVAGILLTMADRFTITADTCERIAHDYPYSLLETVIPKNNDLQKAIGRALSVFEVAPSSKSALAYWRLIAELALL